MTITHNIKIDLVRPEILPPVNVVQGDTCTRQVAVELCAAGAPWQLPAGHDVSIRYGKPDGTNGSYDTLPDKSAAWSSEGNTVSVILCPQMLTCPGTVHAQVCITVGERLLSTFAFYVVVEADPSKGAVKSENYHNWRKAFLPQTEGAKVGQYLQITEVDAEGRVIKVKPVDAPSGGYGGGDLDMKGCEIDNVGTLSFAGPDGTAANGAWLAIDDVFESDDGVVSPVINHLSNDHDAPVIYRNIAPGVEDRDAATVGQLKTRLIAPIKATVGQYIRITAVDENGAVTAVEAVDAPSGSGGADEVYVKLEDGTVVPAEVEFDLSDESTPALVVVPGTAKVGQTIVVKAVDENGKPTEWEAVDLPSGGVGGGVGQWEHICDITTTEDIDAGISVTENSDGVPLSELKYNEIWVMAKMIGVSTNTYSWWKCLCTMHQVGDSTQTYSGKTNGASGEVTTGTRYVTFYTFIRGGKAYWTNCSKIAPYTIAGGDQAWVHNFLDKYLFDYFTEVEIPASSSCIIGADTEIRILGRRV